MELYLLVFKHAIVHPLLKKPHLDQSIFSNFRPISKLPFISKLLERAVYNQLDSYISMSNVLDTFQSGFRSLNQEFAKKIKNFRSRICRRSLLTFSDAVSVLCRSLHSTETASLKVSNDLLQILDTGSDAVLVLLDLSAALTQLIIVFCYSNWKSGWVFRVPLCSGWPRILKIEPYQ